MPVPTYRRRSPACSAPPRWWRPRSGWSAPAGYRRRRPVRPRARGRWTPPGTTGATRTAPTGDGRPGWGAGCAQFLPRVCSAPVRPGSVPAEPVPLARGGRWYDCGIRRRAMAYDDSRFRGEPGFRDEPDFRLDNGLSDATTLGGASNAAVYTPGSYAQSNYPSSSGDASEGTLSLSRRPSQAQLDDVFDDPEHGDPGRDRMAVHAVWEIMLLLAAVGVWYVLYRGHRETVSGAALRGLMVTAASLGLVTLAMGLSLRAAAPNLAVGPIAYGSALFFAGHIDRGGTVVAATVTALLAIAVGVAIVVLVIGFHVPGWAASLAAALGVIVWLQMHADTVRLDDAYNPTSDAMYWFAAFAALALLGGFLGMAKPVRRAVGRFRPVADPAKRRGDPPPRRSAGLGGGCPRRWADSHAPDRDVRPAAVGDRRRHRPGLAIEQHDEHRAERDQLVVPAERQRVDQPVAGPQRRRRLGHRGPLGPIALLAGCGRRL